MRLPGWSLVLSCVLAGGCSQGGGDGSGSGGGGPAAPAVPPASTLALDLSVVDGGLNLNDTDAAFAAPSATNHLQAAFVLSVVNSALASPLVLPVALLRAAADVPAALISTDKWVRSFDMTTGGRQWTANLVAHGPAGDPTDWSLRVTAKPLDSQRCCDDFELAAGEQAASGGGTWQIFDLARPGEGQALFKVAYLVTAKDAKTLSFEVLGTRAPSLRFGRGSSARYEEKGDQVTLTYRDSSEQGGRTLIWSRTTHAGSQTDPQGRRRCWDTQAAGFQDIDCP